MDRGTGFYWLFARCIPSRTFHFGVPGYISKPSLLSLVTNHWGFPSPRFGSRACETLKIFLQWSPSRLSGPPCRRLEGGFPQEIFTLHLQVKKTYCCDQSATCARLHAFMPDLTAAWWEWVGGCLFSVCLCLCVCAFGCIFVGSYVYMEPISMTV